MALLLVCAPAAGETTATLTEADFLDELPIVLSASRLSQPLDEAPAAVTVIDREMIRASGFRDIPDLLRLVPGFSVAYTRDNTWAVGYHGLADAFSRRFQVLVDGRSIYSPHFGAVNWTDLPLAIEDIERIEVVRGPNAAVYGSNAFLAVINIITQRAAQAEGGHVSLQYGEQGMRGLLARYGGGSGDLRWRVTASSQDRDRFEAIGYDGDGRPPVGLRERSRTQFLSGRIDYTLDPRNDLSLQWGLSDGDWHGGRVGVSDEPDRQDAHAAFVHLQFHRVASARREWRGQLYYTRNRFDADALVVAGPLTVPIDQYLLQTRLNLDLQATEQLNDRVRLLWGAEWRRETVDSPQSYYGRGTLDGELGRVFGNVEWRLSPAWLVQGGAMLERHYYTGTELSPRLALNFTPRPDHTLRASVSRAYRSPTFFEQEGRQQFEETGGSVVETLIIPADGALDSERVLSREIGYVGRWRPLSMDVNARLFHDTLTDYIGSQRRTGAICDEPVGLCFQAVNGSTIHLRGGEAELHWRPRPRLDLYAHYARVRIAYGRIVLDGRGDIIDDDLPFSAPRNNFGLLANYRWGDGWQASTGVYRSDDIKWLSDGDSTDGYTRVDLRLARRFQWQGRSAELALVAQSVGNLYSEFRSENRFGPKAYASFSVSW